MRHLKHYVERVSQEDSQNTDVDITEKDPVIAQVDASEPEEVEELISDELVDPAPQQASEQIKEYTDIRTSLEHYNTLLNDAKPRGGLRAEEGALLAVGLRHFSNRLGMDLTTVSQEDFGGNMSRLEATRISQEGIGEMAKEAGKKIIELIQRLIASVKEKFARFDVQGQKVAAICNDMKKRISTFVTGETTYEWDGNQYLNEADLLKPRMLLEATQKITSNISYLSVFFAATKDGVIKFMRSEGDQAAIDDFRHNVTNAWQGAQPFTSIFKDGAGFTLTSTAIAHLAYRGQGDGDAFSHSMQIDRKETTPIKVTINKAQFKALVDTILALNTSVGRLIDEASKACGTVGSINGIQNQLGHLDQRYVGEVTGAINGVVGIVEHDIMPIVHYLASARSEFGYMVAHIGRSFGKDMKV